MNRLGFFIASLKEGDVISGEELFSFSINDIMLIWYVLDRKELEIRKIRNKDVYKIKKKGGKNVHNRNKSQKI